MYRAVGKFVRRERVFVSCATGANVFATPPKDNGRGIERVQRAEKDHRTCYREARSIQALTTAVKNILDIGLAQRLLHQPIGNCVNQYGTLGTIGSIIH